MTRLNSVTTVTWYEPPLLGDERISADVRFCDNHGWEWSVRHYSGQEWHTLDSGLARSFNGALHELQRTLGELDQT